MAGPAAFVFEGEWIAMSDETTGKARRARSRRLAAPASAVPQAVPRSGADPGGAARGRPGRVAGQLPAGSAARQEPRTVAAPAGAVRQRAGERAPGGAHASADAGADAAGQRRRHAARDGGERWPRISTATWCAWWCSSRSHGLDDADWLQVIAADDARLQPFRDCLADGEPLCGRLQPEKHALLYGDARRGSAVEPRCCRCRAWAWSPSAAAMPTVSSPAWARCSCA